MIAVIDYDTGNILSVANALRRLGADFAVTPDPAAIRAATHVILPGVGEAGSAMASLKSKGLDKVVESLTRPVLGICIGMQLMCRHSQESDTPCMGIFQTDVRCFAPAPGLKIPHMGWNTVGEVSSPLFDGMSDDTYFYYVHSFAAGLCPQTAATTDHGRVFSAALRQGNFHGVQFHPEKSGAAGERLLRNFLNL